MWTDDEWLEVGDPPVVDPPSITLNVTEDEPIGTILGPDGEPFHTVFPPKQRFGFGLR